MEATLIKLVCHKVTKYQLIQMSEPWPDSSNFTLWSPPYSQKVTK